MSKWRIAPTARRLVIRPASPQGPKGVKGDAGLGEVAFPTKAALEAAHVPPTVNAPLLLGYAAAGDGGGALYRRVASEPDHPGKIQSANGAWWELAADKPSVAMFGADLTGGSNSVAAWDDCFAYCVATHKSMFIDGGSHLLATEFVADYSTWTDDSDTEGPSIVGAGRGVTKVLGAIKILGGTTGAGLSVHVTVSELKFIGATAGLRGEKAAFFTARDIFTAGCDDGIILTDCLSAVLHNVRTRWGKRGMTVQRSTVSEPNALTLVGCHAGQCSEYGILADQATQFVMLGGSIESCGLNAAGMSSWGIKHTGNVGEGQSGLTLRGVHFEGNGGAADVWIDSGSQDCVHDIDACNLLRVSNTKFVEHNIRIDQSDAAGDGVPYVNVNKCSFKGYNSYVADADRKYIKVLANRAIVNQSANYFASSTEAPSIPEGATFAECRFNGTGSIGALAFARSRNVTDVTKNNTGDYTITYMVPSWGVVAVEGNLNAAGVIYLFSATSTTCRVLVRDLDDAPLDVGQLRIAVIHS